VSGTIAIGNTISLQESIIDFSGSERGAGEDLVVEKVSHEHTRHTIVMATPANWARNSVTHRTAHKIRIDGEYCFYLDELYEAVDGVPF
jgi:hypothetical protein